jgi:hypothetical protein
VGEKPNTNGVAFLCRAAERWGTGEEHICGFVDDAEQGFVGWIECRGHRGVASYVEVREMRSDRP